MSTFENLTDEQVEEIFEELLAEGYTEDQAFTEIYSKDCSLDNDKN